MSPSDVKAKMMMLFMMMSSGFGGSGGDEGSSAPRLPKYEKFGITVENKSELLARSLALLKMVIDPGFMSWKEVPYELKLAVWAALEVIYLYIYMNLSISISISISFYIYSQLTLYLLDRNNSTWIQSYVIPFWSS